MTTKRLLSLPVDYYRLPEARAQSYSSLRRRRRWQTNRARARAHFNIAQSNNNNISCWCDFAAFATTKHNEHTHTTCAGVTSKLQARGWKNNYDACARNFFFFVKNLARNLLFVYQCQHTHTHTLSHVPVPYWHNWRPTNSSSRLCVR